MACPRPAAQNEPMSLVNIGSPSLLSLRWLHHIQRILPRALNGEGATKRFIFGLIDNFNTLALIPLPLPAT